MHKDEKTEGLASSTVNHRYGSVEYYLRDESHAISLATHARNAPYQGTSPRRPFPGVRRLYAIAPSKIIRLEQILTLLSLLEGGNRAPAISSSSRCRRYPDSTGGMVDSSLNNAVSTLKYFRTEVTRSFGRAYGQPGRRPESAGIR